MRGRRESSRLIRDGSDVGSRWAGTVVDAGRCRGGDRSGGQEPARSRHRAHGWREADQPPAL